MLYKPTQNIIEGLRNLFPLELCPWDDYFARMAQTDFFLNRHKKIATKTFFIRKAPFGGSFALVGGINALFRTLIDYRFTDDVGLALNDMGYKKEFISYLINDLKQLQVRVYSVSEGNIIFPNEPIVTAQGDLVSIRFVEGIITKCMNFPTLAMTKWRRVVDAAAPGKTYEFSRRRAQNDLITSLYAHMAGVDISSNAEIRRAFDIPISGSMGHEWLQSFGDEFEAFDKWLEINPDRPILLVDTIDTLKYGLPNAIKAFKKHWERIKACGGIPGMRNDSGDLAYLTIEERRLLDSEGLEDVLIFQTNDLDEYSIQSIREQIFTQAPKAGLDPFKILSKIVWACGTNPGTCSDQPSIGGVAKLTTIENDKGEEKAVIKLAKDNPIKTSIPGYNRSAHIYDGKELICCLIFGHSESLRDLRVACHPEDESKKIYLNNNVTYRSRQIPIFDKGHILMNPDLLLNEVRVNVRNEVESLHWTYKRFESPHTIKVYLSENLFKLRNDLIRNTQLIES